MMDVWIRYIRHVIFLNQAPNMPLALVLRDSIRNLLIPNPGPESVDLMYKTQGQWAIFNNCSFDTVHSSKITNNEDVYYTATVIFMVANNVLVVLDRLEGQYTVFKKNYKGMYNVSTDSHENFPDHWERIRNIRKNLATPGEYQNMIQTSALTQIDSVVAPALDRIKRQTLSNRDFALFMCVGILAVLAWMNYSIYAKDMELKAGQLKLTGSQDELAGKQTALSHSQTSMIEALEKLNSNIGTVASQIESVGAEVSNVKRTVSDISKKQNIHDERFMALEIHTGIRSKDGLPLIAPSQHSSAVAVYQSTTTGWIWSMFGTIFAWVLGVTFFGICVVLVWLFVSTCCIVSHEYLEQYQAIKTE